MKHGPVNWTVDSEARGGKVADSIVDAAEDVAEACTGSGVVESICNG